MTTAAAPDPMGPLVNYEARNGVPCAILTRSGYERLLGERAEMLEMLRVVASRARPVGNVEQANISYNELQQVRAAIAKAEGK